MSDENVERCARALLNAKLAMDDPTIIATVLVPEVEWDALRSALARASRQREAGMYVQQVPFKGCACAGCLAGDPLHHPYLCETCYAKVVPAPKWEAT